MTKTIIFLTFSLAILISCLNHDDNTIISLYQKDLTEKSKLLGELIKNRVYESHRYKGYDLEFYSKNQDSIIKIFNTIENKVSLNAQSNRQLLKNYLEVLNQINIYCDTLKRHPKFFFHADLDKIRATAIDTNSLLKIKDTNFLKLLLITNLKTQLNDISFLSQNFGCHMATYFKNGNFHDFFILQANSKTQNICNITIKNNFLSEIMDNKHYTLSFKSIKKILNDDSILVREKVNLKKYDGVYKTNNFTLEKGKYVFTTGIHFENPNGKIKVGEMIFDFNIE